MTDPSARSKLPRRGMMGVLAAGVAGVVILGVPVEQALTKTQTKADGLAALINAVTAGLSPGQPYRPPSANELSLAGQGFAALLAADRAVPTALGELGFTVSDDVDPVTGRPYTLAVGERHTDRSWGVVIIDRSAPPSLVVEVPHPGFDLHTELFGLDLFRAVPGAVLVMAGAHRRADHRMADVAHQTDSVFQAVAAVLAARSVPQVQLHGFHDQRRTGAQLVVSPGATPVSPLARRVADRLVAERFSVCRTWVQSCNGLEGRTNVQGRAAAAIGTVFVHVEMCRAVRDDAVRRAAVVRALADAQLRVI